MNAMIAIILRIVLGLLAVGFIGWYLYITWLGLKTFFRLPSEIAITGDKININKKDNEKKEDNNGKDA